MLNVVHPFNYHGCRVNEWELAGKVGEIATLKASLLGEDESTDIALAAASYPAAANLMTFVEGSLTVGGNPMDIKEFNIGGDNKLAGDRYFFGSRLRKQALDNGVREYTGELDTEFVDLTAYNRFVNGVEAALVLLFESATVISGALKFQTKVTANVRFDGETPKVSGAEALEQPLAFKCLGNTAATAITVDYQTTDTAPQGVHVNPDDRITDEQRNRLDVIAAVYNWLNVEVTSTDLVSIAHWIATGSNVYGIGTSETVELETNDTASWSPAVD